MNKISIAEELLKTRAANCTDATAFVVNVRKGEHNKKEGLILTPDTDRRGDRDGTFYHMETVVDVCRTLHLSSYISSKVYYDEQFRSYRATFEVHIY